MTVPRDVTIHSIDNRCYLKVTSHPNNRYTRTASWYQIWEGVILLNAMCIRAGKKGTFKVFSDGKSITVLGSDCPLMIGHRSRHEPQLARSRSGR